MAEKTTKLTPDEILAQQGDLPAEFARDVRTYIRKDLAAKDAQDRRSLAGEPVLEYVKEHGVLNREGTAQRIMLVRGWKVQYTAKVGQKVDEAARLAWCQEHAPNVIDYLPSVNQEKWDALKALGRIPQAVIDEAEQDTTSYHLRVWLEGEGACPKCGGTVHTDMTYCLRCALKLPFDKKRQKRKPRKKKAAKKKVA